MSSTFRRCAGLTCGLAYVLAACGCTRISVAPTCPEALVVGESGPVDANEVTPGAIATYAWEVFPSTAGTFADPNSASTTFEADAPGGVIIQLTAGDGLFIATGQCRTRIETIGVIVELQAQPSPVVGGDSVTLTCTSVGDIGAVTFRIEQSGGTPVDLTTVSPGVVTVTTATAGELTFQCVGVGADGSESDPLSVTISVTEPPADTDGGRGGGRT
ncbi:MAG: hypothetical protein IID35_07570 [Planctomycetes bacterium]|nr:hypothetical protein [Planctomycetota bacterium]